MKLRVSDIQKMWKNNLGTLVAGRGGIDRLVEHYDVMEQPDIVPWVRENTIIITTGYAIRNHTSRLLTIMKGLNEINASAIAIKTRFFEDFPSQVIELANELDFPLFFLNNDVSFSRIFHPIMYALVENERHDRASIFNYNEIAKKKEDNNRFFLDLCTKKITQIEEASYRSNELAWPQGEIRLVLIKLIDDFSYSEKSKYSLVKSMKLYLRNYRIKSKVLFLNNSLIFVLKEINIKLYEEIFRKLLNQLNTKLNCKLDCIISKSFFNYLSLAEAYNDVKNIASVRNKIVDKEIIWVEKNMYDLMLFNLSSSAKVRDYVNFSLYELDMFDKKHSTNLVETLREFINNNGSRKETAEKLFLHRNTVSYRLRKIEDILGVKLTDFRIISHLGFACRMREYFDVHDAQNDR